MNNKYLNQYCIIRADRAGVFAGILAERNGTENAYGGDVIRHVKERMQ